MHKTLEVWNTRRGPKVVVAVRKSDGTFHGATNYPLIDSKKEK